MQEFYIEVHKPVNIVLADPKSYNQSAHLLIVPNKEGDGFTIHVESISSDVSVTNDYEFSEEFVFDAKEIEKRFAKMRGD